MEKIRVYELARELDTNSKRLMEKLAEIGVIVKNHMSLLEDSELDALYKHIGMKAKAQDAAHADSGQPPNEPVKSPSGAAEAASQRIDKDDEKIVRSAADNTTRKGVTPSGVSPSGVAPSGVAQEKTTVGASAARASDATGRKGVTPSGVTPSGVSGTAGAMGGRGSAAAGVSQGNVAGAFGGSRTAAGAGGGARTQHNEAAGRLQGVKPAGAAPTGARNAATTARDAKEAQGAPKTGKSAPRIIRTTEINLDRAAREDRRDNMRQQSAGPQPAAVRDGERNRRGGRDHDRDRRRRDFDRSEFYRAPDSNSGLIAGFTRMTREESMKQLLAEARAQQKKTVVMPDDNRGKPLPDVKTIGDTENGAAAGIVAEDPAAQAERAARIDRLARIDASVIAGISETAGTADKDITGKSDAPGGPGMQDVTVVADGAAARVSSSGVEKVPETGPEADLTSGSAATAGSEITAAQKQTPEAGVITAAQRSETVLKPAPEAKGRPSVPQGEISAATVEKSAQPAEKSAQSAERSAQPAERSAQTAEKSAQPSERSIHPRTDRDAVQRGDTGLQQRGAAGARPGGSADGRPGVRQQEGRPGVAAGGRAGGVRESRPGGTADGRPGGRTPDGRSQPRASFDGRGYQQQYEPGRTGQPGAERGAPDSRRQADGRPPDRSRPLGQDGRPRDGYRQQDGRQGSYHQQGQTGVYQQRDQSGARRDGRPLGAASGDRPFRPRDDRTGSPGGDRPYQQRDGAGRQFASQGGVRQGDAARPGGPGRPGMSAGGDRRQGGARPRTDFTKPAAFTRSEENTAVKTEQKRDYTGRDSAKEAKKNLNREAAKTAPASAPKKSRFKPQVSIIGEKKGVQAFTDDEFIINEFYDASDESKRSRRQQRQRKALRKEKYIPPRAILTSITIGESLTVKELAEALKKTASDVISRLMGLGMSASINEVLDYDTAALVAGEFGIAAERAVVVNEEDILFDESDSADEDGLATRPPVVVVMGHVDHGKTSLLDAIRKTNVISSEAGGITQHIGAYMVNINGRAITFLDTPGHEAFTSMRARGAMVTDIAILVVSAVDGVMPQTVEAINHAKAAGVSLIIAINMIDREGANPDRVKQQLTEYDILVEEWGGEVIAVPVSAKTGENIGQLLEMIILTADMLELRADPDRQAKGTIIEAKLDRSRGPVATLLVQRGTLNVGDSFITGATVGRIRAMLDDGGNSIQKAGPSMPVEIIGLSEVPEAGEVFYVTTDDKVTKSLAEKRRLLQREEQLKSTSSRVTLDDLFSKIKEGKVKELNLIIKADVQGSVEAVRQSVEKLGNDEVRVNVIHSGVGAINESDVSLASVSSAIIIGFNVRPGGASVIEAADIMGIDIRLYTVIYNAIEDIQAAMKGMLDPTFREVVLGHVEIRQIFRASGVGTIGGCFVLDGKIQRSNSIRILRDGVSIFSGKLASLRRFKDDAREVVQGYECGIAIERFNDIKENDIIEPYMMEEIPVV